MTSSVDEVAVDEVAVDEVAVDDVDDVAEVDVVDDAEIVPTTSPVDERDDDVVVDLFARLRAESVVISPDDDLDDHSDDNSDDHSDDSDDRPDDDVTVVADSVVVEAVEIDAAPRPDDGEVPPTPFERRDADLTPIIVSSARKLKRVLADEQNEVLDALRRKRAGPRARRAASLGRRARRPIPAVRSAPNWPRRPTPGRPWSAGRASSARPTPAAAVEAGRRVLADWLVEPLRERLERCVADGDGDNAGISKRVRAVYREWKTQHIDEQLDDVFRAAHGRGALAAIAPGTPVVWVCDTAATGCADCDDNSLAGPVPAGQAFPTGHRVRSGPRRVPMPLAP